MQSPHSINAVACGLDGGSGHPPFTSIVYDAHNWLRRRFEAGASIRVCLAELKVKPGTVVFDGPGGLRRRRDIYPEYKAGRKYLAQDMSAQFDLFQRLVKHVPKTICIRAKGWEADDVIATLVRTIGGRVQIRSTDVDFLQLPGVTIDERKPFPVGLEFIRTYKASVGDRSDNIPGIHRFGEQAWNKLDLIELIRLRKFLAGERDDPPEHLPKASLNWLADPTNTKLVRSFYQIIDFYDVPMQEILDATVVGQDEPEVIEQVLKGYLQ